MWLCAGETLRCPSHFSRFSCFRAFFESAEEKGWYLIEENSRTHATQGSAGIAAKRQSPLFETTQMNFPAVVLPDDLRGKVKYLIVSDPLVCVSLYRRMRTP